MTTLDELRVRMRGIDAEILHLVAARLETARQVGALKRQAGVPLRDWEVERQALDNAARVAAEAGVPEALARTLMQALIAGARAEQERHHFAAYRGPTHEIAVLGGRGRMGRWLADFLANQGHGVRVFDVVPGDSPDASLPNVLGGADVAFVATPLEVVPDSIRAVADAGFRGVVCDIASLKGHLPPAIEYARKAGVRVASVHPMFGPSARTLSDKVICICDCGDAEAIARVRKLFCDTAATLVDLSLEEHDRIMSYVLGLSHIINILFARVLAVGERTFRLVNAVGSTTFHSQMVTTATVVDESPELYYAIQRLNPFTPSLYAALERELRGLTESVLAGNPEAFRERMLSGRQWMRAGDGTA
ncbi:MAG: prephenate dehydrogenase/arogenate dehydrogenase family protein [Phycisphaerae bacterium]|jgi:chorismate mutase/prephenate dehydrogenase